MSFNKVVLLGRLGADPELRYTASQMPICTLKLATNERRKSADGEWADHTEWHTVVTFGKTAENCNQYLQKGRQALVEGRIQTRKYQDQEGKDRYFTEIIANTVQFVGGNNRSEGMEIEKTSVPRQPNNPTQGLGATPPPNMGTATGSALGETVTFDDDDIPF